MKISLNWLQDFVTFSVADPMEIARRITATTAEVDEVEIQGVLLDNCCVGEILSVAKHPDADRLSVCEVRTDQGTKNVVCGGTNLRSGMQVAFAHVGARVRWHGDELVTLERAKIRGQESEGMICAAEELGIESLYPAKPEDGERPIVDLTPSHLQTGAPLREALGLNDTVLHIDNHAITHRADLFSHVGFARECVATGLATWKESAKPRKPRFGTKPLPLAFRNDVPTLIPRYCSCLLSIDGIGTTPEWMKRRLEATGWRSVSLPVDITNYVSMELGMPLHSFDADDFHGTVIMRTSRKGESIVTLDGIERALPDGALVLSDDQGIFDLLGIMGGLRSSTKESTRHVYLHSAIADPVFIRRAVIATGHRTDAATTYEKGIPRIRAKEGFLRALELFLQLAPGAKIVSEMQEEGDDSEAPTIHVEAARVTRLLGDEIPAATMAEILTALGCSVKGGKGKHPTLSVVPPLYRPDLKTQIDIAEEVGRIYGYDRIAPRMPVADTTPPARDTRVNALRDALKQECYLELLPLSLTGATLMQRAGLDPSQAITVQNAINDETSLLHTSVVPALLDHAQRNRLLMGERLKTFTVGHVFAKGVPERTELALLVGDAQAAHAGDDALKRDPLLLLKRDLAMSLQLIGYQTNDAQLTQDLPAYAHPGRAATLGIGDTRIGTLCEVHPDIRERFELPGRTAVAVLDLSALLSLAPAPRIIRPLPQFPAIQYDVTVTKRQTEPIGPLLAQLRKADPLLEQVEVVDLYSGKPLTGGQYNLTLRFTYRAPDRTLTEEEAQAVHAKLSQMVA